MKNRPIHLVDHLMAQAESLRDESLTSEQLDREIQRARALCTVGNTIVNVQRVQIDAFRAASDAGLCPQAVPLPLEHQGSVLPAIEHQTDA